MQQLSITGNKLSIANGNTVTLPTEGKTHITGNAIDAYNNDANLIVNRLTVFGYLQLAATVTGTKTIYLYFQLPSMINDVPQRIESVTVAYKAINPLSYISNTMVALSRDNGSTINPVINNFTVRRSSSWTTYTVSDSSPELISGAVVVKIVMEFGGTGHFYNVEIGSVTLTLTN